MIEQTPFREPVFAFIILAGGTSSRFGSKKELALLPNGQTPLQSLLGTAAASSSISHIHVVYHAAYQAEILSALQHLDKSTSCSPAGDTRQQSVLGALRSLATYGPDFVLIHDGARPWLSPQLLEAVCHALPDCPAVIPTIAAAESIKMINSDQEIITHLPRTQLGIAQTPQGFLFTEILAAHEHAQTVAANCTDDAEVWGLVHQQRVCTIPGEITNKKITFRGDIT